MKTKDTQPRYKCVFLLSADITKNGDSYELAESDKGGVLLAEWRLKACKVLLDSGITEKIVVVGWHDETYPEVSRSVTLRTILIDEYGVDESFVEAVQQKEDGTYGNVQEILSYMSTHELIPSECAVLTNFYHLPRTMQNFTNVGHAGIMPLAAESFFPEEIADITKAYASSEFSKRLETELQKLNPLA